MNHTPTPLKTVLANLRGIAKSHPELELDRLEIPAIEAACNAHEDLVKALKEANRYILERGDSTSDWQKEIIKANKKAIAKAGVKL